MLIELSFLNEFKSINSTGLSAGQCECTSSDNWNWPIVSRIARTGTETASEVSVELKFCAPQFLKINMSSLNGRIKSKCKHEGGETNIIETLKWGRAEPIRHHNLRHLPIFLGRCY